MKVLVVDDALLERKLMTGILKKAGVAVEFLEASNGEEALKVLAAHYKDIRVILLDWQMPVMSGLEFMEGVVKVPATASIPIVMVTASGSEENRKQAMAINPKLAGYVVKPYKAEDLVNSIKPFLK